jgi:hypothetical protein
MNPMLCAVSGEAVRCSALLGGIRETIIYCVYGLLPDGATADPVYLSCARVCLFFLMPLFLSCAIYLFYLAIRMKRDAYK